MLPLSRLDKALLSFGFPVGPIALLDEVGVDVAQHVQTSLAADLGVRMGGADVAAMTELVESGMLGRKTGAGFFKYSKKGKKEGLNPDVQTILKKHMKSDAGAKLELVDIQERMAFRFINEAVLCLQDDIIRSPVDGDIGAVFGIGFPPFRGGPFRFVDAYGADNFVARMQEFQGLNGDHFEPCQMLKDMAANGSKFH